MQLTTSTPGGTTAVPTVVWNLAYEPISIDPAKTQYFAEGAVEGNVTESLLRMTPDLGAVPNLAESYKRMNSVTWRYDIRTDVHFSDGHLLTPADVVASLRRHIDPTSGSYWGFYFANVKSIDQSGPHQVTIHLTRPDELFNSELTTAGGAISEASALESAGANYGSPNEGLMGTGPFMFKSWTPGDNITLVRNPNYWDKSRQPLVDTLVFKFIANDSTVTSALLDGSVQGMYEVPVSGIPQLSKATDGTLYLGPAPASLDLIPTEKPGPLHSAQIRQALFLGLDRQAIADGVYHGAAVPAKSYVTAVFGYAKPIFNSYMASLPSPSVNLDEARKLVASEPQWKNTEISLATSPDAGLQTIANAYQTLGKELGLKITIVTLTPAQTSQLFFDKGFRTKYDAFLSPQFTEVPDPLEQLLFVMPGSVYNYGLYDNPEYIQLVNRALGTPDPDTRAKVLVQAMTIADQDLPFIPIVELPERVFLSNELTGIPTSWSYLYGSWADQLGGK
jgi:peptide/nickel transport system substrate-binding protein